MLGDIKSMIMDYKHKANYSEVVMDCPGFAPTLEEDNIEDEELYNQNIYVKDNMSNAD